MPHSYRSPRDDKNASACRGQRQHGERQPTANTITCENDDGDDPPCTMTCESCYRTLGVYPTVQERELQIQIHRQTQNRTRYENWLVSMSTR
jgi:hypothetical protein